MLRKIAIANQKGGSGKTATSINLSAALAERGNRVLLIDLDPQLHATEGVGVDPYQDDIKTVYELIFDDKVICSDVIIKTEVPNLDVIPASEELEETDIDFFRTTRAEYKIADKLKALNGYDFVFFDCPPRLNHLTINALVASDSLLIPVSSIGKRSLNTLPRFHNYVERVQKHLNHELKIIGYLVNQHRKNVKVSEKILSAIKNTFGSQVFNTIISFTANLAEADTNDEPVIFSPMFRQSKLANEYRSFAEEIENKT